MAGELAEGFISLILALWFCTLRFCYDKCVLELKSLPLFALEQELCSQHNGMVMETIVCNKPWKIRQQFKHARAKVPGNKNYYLPCPQDLKFA